MRSNAVMTRRSTHENETNAAAERTAWRGLIDTTDYPTIKKAVVRRVITAGRLSRTALDRWSRATSVAVRWRWNPRFVLSGARRIVPYVVLVSRKHQ